MQGFHIKALTYFISRCLLPAEVISAAYTNAKVFGQSLPLTTGRSTQPLKKMAAAANGFLNNFKSI
jgi:hypothetical protein